MPSSHTSSESSSGRNTLAAAVLIGLLSALIYFVAQGVSDPSGYQWFGALLAVQMAPILLSMVRRKWDFLAFTIAVHIAGYTLSKYSYWSLFYGSPPLPAGTVLELQEMIRGYLFVIVAYYITKALSLPFDRYTKEPEYRIIHVSPSVAIIALVHSLTSNWLSGSVPAQFFAPYTISANLATILLLCITTGSRPGDLCLFFGGLISSLLNYVYSGFMGGLFSFTFVWLVSCCLRRQYRKLPLGLLMVLSVFVLNLSKAKYREIVWVDNPGLGLFERIGAFTTILTAQEEPVFRGEPSETGESAESSQFLFTSVGRLYDDSLERVLTMTPSQVPYWNGRTYLPLLYSLVPRFVWPTKPMRDWPNEFGRLYRVLGENDYQTSIAISVFAEGYMNFGYVGLYGAAIVLGIFLALFERMSSTLLRGKYLFGFILFLLPFLNYQTEMVVMIQPAFLMGLVAMGIRPWLLRKVRKLAAIQAGVVG